MKYTTAVVLVFLVAHAAADVYMHNPRGSNDRLNEANTNRNNGNRMFDSQNNAKGGYCYGPQMGYYEGSQLSIEWTNQHGCGVNPKMYCNLVIQYMCTDDDAGGMTRVRDGTTTDTIDSNNEAEATELDGTNFKYGMHESFQYYQDCATRDRNMGLFIADREDEGNLNTGRAASIFTRQNNDGNRHGLECAEERDYYPYWHPSPWRDVAVLTYNTDWCDFYKKNSQNVQSKGYCYDKTKNDGSQAKYNNEAACESNGNKWKKAGSHGIPAPDCVRAPLSRENHLGNGVTGHNNVYNWTLPKQKDLGCINDNKCACALRLRYNISTAELKNSPNGKFVDWTSNADKSPVHQDPIKQQDGLNFSMALDTSQFGRTFQDRSYTFEIRPRPKDVPEAVRIFNLNVRGKRGNIVQTYPATEYDFVPQNLYARVGDYIHFQWTGCDTNPAGNAGEGTDGTDRSNIVQITSLDKSVPASDSWLNSHDKMFPDKKTRMRMSMLDQKDCKTYAQLLADHPNDNNGIEQDTRNCMKLNAAPTGYFDGGLIKMENIGTYYYMSSRNHNFSNRDQKGVVHIDPLLPIWAIALLAIGGTLFLGSGGVAGAMFYAKAHPTSQVAQILKRF